MNEATLRTVLTAQYNSGLAMLKQAVEICPESLWASTAYPNRFWHLAYHVLFYTDLYLCHGLDDFKPWTNHRQNLQFLGPSPYPPHDLPPVDPPLSKADVLEYQAICRDRVADRLPVIDLAAASGFPWLPFGSLERQLYSIRHLQHHTGQLADRLRTSAGLGVSWVGTA